MNNGYVAGLAARYTAESINGLQDESVPAKTTADNDTARQNAVADLNRPIGNWTIYNYYLTSAGRRNVVIWTCLMVFYSMLLRFPGKVIPECDLTLS